MTDHPFTRHEVETVAARRGLAPEQLDRALERVQSAVERGHGSYEYSSQHSFGWQGADATYLYGDGVWHRLAGQCGLSGPLRAAARAVHGERMLRAAEHRGHRGQVAEMLATGTEPLVVAKTATGPPRTGQGFSV